MNLTISNKKLMFTSIGSGIFLSALLSGVLWKIDSALIGASVELFTIPMIILQILITAYTLYWVLIKKNKLTIDSIIIMLIFIISFTAMFLVR